MVRWKSDPAGEERGVYTEVPLSNGQFLHLGALRYGTSVFDGFNVELEVHEGVYSSDDYDLDRHGTAIGPGGTEVWGVVSGLLTGLEEVVASRFGDCWIEVEPASARLAVFYERYLVPRGYRGVYYGDPGGNYYSEDLIFEKWIDRSRPNG